MVDGESQSWKLPPDGHVHLFCGMRTLLLTQVPDSNKNKYKNKNV